MSGPAAPSLVAGTHYAGHERQPEPWGCIYRSLVALTGERSLLSYEADTNLAAAFVRLPEVGLSVWTLAKHHDGDALPAAFWQDHVGWLSEVAPAGGPLAFSQLLLGVPSLHVPENDGKGGRPSHLVAAVTGTDGVVILDPSAPAERRYGLAGFLASPYGRAFEAHRIVPDDPGHHEHLDGPSAPHVAATRQRWAETVLAAI